MTTPSNILAFDTCFDACSVAVFRADTGDITSERELMRRGHAEALLPMIERAMQRSGLTYRDLGRIAVTHGPGTFTGARVGMSAALGLAFAHNLPVVTYSSLQAIARSAIHALGVEAVSQFDGIVVARDAKRNSVYLEVTSMSGEQITAPALLQIPDAVAEVSGRNVFALGTGIALMQEAAQEATKDGEMSAIVTQWPSAPPAGADEPDARFLLTDAATRQPAASPVPLYLRPPDATPSSTPPLARLLDTSLRA